MKKEYFNAVVKENIKVCKDIYSLKIVHEVPVRPGQFYMLKPKGQLLGRPISVCEVCENEVTFLYAVVGNGTKEFKDLKQNDEIEVIGPLGNGFDIDKAKGRIALVGGGIGVAPLLQLAKEIKASDSLKKIDFYGGYREEVYLENRLKDYVDNLYISTNTGIYGHKGFVTDLLETEKYDTVLCCGPEIMMEKVVSMCKEKEVTVYVSMEKHMACGVGACLVCTCKTKNGNKRTCKDGPVFNGEDVLFD